MLPPMDWEDLRHVLALARGGTLSAAAAPLGVVRTTVGRRVTALEERLGVRLFDRTPEGFVPTAAGADLVAVAEQVEASILEAEARVAGRDVALTGDLRVSTLDWIYDRYTQVFRDFLERYPGVRLTVCDTTSTVSLRRREADVVLRVGDAPAPHLVGRRVDRLAFVPFAHRDLVARHGTALADLPWIADDERAGSPWFDTWLAEHAPGARIAMRYDSFAVMRRSVLAGVGAHLLPEWEDDPRLVRVGPEVPPIAQDLWVLTLSDLRTNLRVRAFLDHVYEALAAPA